MNSGRVYRLIVSGEDLNYEKDRLFGTSMNNKQVILNATEIEYLEFEEESYES